MIPQAIAHEIDVSEVAKLTASDAAANDRFGDSVSISDDIIVVGARFDDDAGSSSGSVYVFGKDVGGDDNWGQITKLTASDAAAVDRFGDSVSISDDIIVVGAPNDDDAGSSSGSAYVFSEDEVDDDDEDEDDDEDDDEDEDEDQKKSNQLTSIVKLFQKSSTSIISVLNRMNIAIN